MDKIGRTGNPMFLVAMDLDRKFIGFPEPLTVNIRYIFLYTTDDLVDVWM